MSKSAHGSALPRTNAMRMLDAARIPYEVLTYEVDENDLSGVHIAEQLSYPPEMIFKTLVAHGDRTGYLVFCIPVALEIDLRTAASRPGTRKSRWCTSRICFPDRIHPRRLFPHRHEEKVPYLL